MAAVAAPRIDTNVSADSEFYIPDTNALAAPLDLTAVAGKPNCCPQRVLLINNNSTAGAGKAVIVTAEKNTNSRTVTVPPGQIIDVPTPIATIAKNPGDSIAVWVFWWGKAGVQYNRGNPA